MFPDGFHPLAAIDSLHELVIEGVARFGIFGGPDDGFGGVDEVAAGEIGRGIGLDPGNVVEELEAELLHGEADGMDDVGGAGGREPGKRKSLNTEDTEDAERAQRKQKQGELKLAATEAGRT